MDIIKVAIIDYDLEWIKLITDLLHKENDMAVMWNATNKKTAIIHAGSKDVDIILMNNNLDGEGKDIDNLAATKEIASVSQAKVIMITSFFDETLIINSVFDGVANYILKNDFINIPVIIRSTYGKVFLPIETIINDYYKIKHELNLSRLTPVERQLYSLKQQGYTTYQIAIKTKKSEGTIRNQLSKAYKKLKTRKD